MLKGNGKGGFEVIPNYKSGLFLSGEIRGLQKIVVGNKVYYLAIRNNNTIESFTLSGEK